MTFSNLLRILDVQLPHPLRVNYKEDTSSALLIQTRRHARRNAFRETRYIMYLTDKSMLIILFFPFFTYLITENFIHFMT